MTLDLETGAQAPKGTPLNRPGLGLLLTMVALAWGMHILDFILPGDFGRLGIHPRRMSGLPGIFLSPVLHGDWGHLIANTLTFCGLGLVVLVAEGRRFIVTTLILIAVSGLGTWLIGRNAIHIGASGLIYGYFGYVLGRAIWSRRVSWAVVGVVVGLVYGWMIWGVLPKGGPVSWEGHLAGLLAGLWLGRLHAVMNRPKAEELILPSV